MKTIEQILRDVEKPARYLGGEYNSVVKDHATVPMKVALAFPDTYEIGMSHLGLRILYDLFNRRPDMLMERVFAPWPDLEKELRENAQPLFSLETRSPLTAFDVVGFTLQFEMCYTNILTMLDLAGIPLRARDRSEEHPLIVGGGPVAFSPEPIADFFDLFHIGDGEECFPRLVEVYTGLRRDLAAALPDPRERRERILRELTQVPGTYVPRFYATRRDAPSGLDYVVPREDLDWEPPFPVKRAVVDDINKYPFPSKTIVPHAEIVHDRVSVEIARGCTEGCRFCQAGIIYRPVRERTPESILDSALSGLESTGYDEVSITSLSPADYSCFPALIEKVMDRMADSRVGVSVSSLRPYGLTAHLAEQIGRVKKTGFTIAPEAGSQRMRDVLNKGITEEHILTAARNASRQGWDLIKLYMMIGVVGETEADLDAMVDLGHRIYDIQREELKRLGGRLQPRVNLSASSHIPKPFAPFQWMAMEPVATLYAKQQHIAERIKRRGIKFKRHHVEASQLEGVMSRGDRRVADVIEMAWRKGCRFDGWTEHFRHDLWIDAFRETGVDPEVYLAEIPVTSRLPWDHIDCLVEKAFLLREYERAKKALLSPACEKPYRRHNLPPEMTDKLICYDCGCACDLDHIRKERVEGYHALLRIEPLRRPLAPPPPGGPGFRYRGAFRKLGPTRFLSHLDLLRTMGRALRRAGISLKYTQGFNPRPMMSFSPALAVGIESEEEYVDFVSGAPLPPEAVGRINAALPDGLSFARLVPLAEGAPSLSKAIAAATYLARVPDGAGVGSRELREAVDAFNEAAERFIDKVRKERSVSLDLKRLVGKVALLEEPDAGPVLRFPVALDHADGSVKPDEVLRGILGRDLEGVSYVRERLHFAAPQGVS